MLLVVAPKITDQEICIKQIRAKIRSNCYPRHMPAEVFFVSDLPRTFNGKLAEVAVADLAHNRKVRNLESLINPEILSEIDKLLV